MLASPPPSTDPFFVPRKEFIRDQSATPSSFSLLAIAGSNCIRLYSFSPLVLSALQRFLEQSSLVLEIREDHNQNYCQFSLDNKPWANPKSVATEKLLLDILTLIYRCGYKYLSSIDYGRETDDRLAIAFSKPVPVHPPGSTSPIPLPPNSPMPDGSIYNKNKNSRVPFALSFASATLMRVISPPLHLTPAILTSVRGAWPRGVVSEKKVGENSYEFRLKGYKWFQQDTFAADSLRHILSLLSALDAHAFTLFTSISLTTRSRVKDLWIFTGPAEDSNLDPEQSLTDSALSGMKQRANTPEIIKSPTLSSQSLHHRNATTDPMMATVLSQSSQHVREATDDPNYRSHLTNDIVAVTCSPHALRKPAPRAQVPISAIHEDNEEISEVAHRVALPSIISGTDDNMTGVGTLGHAQPLDTACASATFEGYGRGRSPPLRSIFERAKTPPLQLSSPSNTSPRAARTLPDNAANVSGLFSDNGPHTSPSATVQLLGPDVFRESAFSTSHESNRDTQWSVAKELIDEPKPVKTMRSKLVVERQPSNGPLLPGAWQATPIEEKLEDEFEQKQDGARVEKSGTTTPIHENLWRVESPEVVPAEMSARKSEAGQVGMAVVLSMPPLLPLPMATLNAPTPPRTPPNKLKKDSHSSAPTGVDGGSGGGEGWVLVNVEGAPSSSPAATQGESTFPPRLSLSAGPTTKQVVTSPDSSSKAQHAEGRTPVPPAAKAIVIMDAIDSKDRKTQSTAHGDSLPNRGLSRFFSLNRKHSRKIDDGESSGSNEAASTIPRSGFRERLRLIGTPEAARKDSKRRSIE